MKSTMSRVLSIAGEPVFGRETWGSPGADSSAPDAHLRALAFDDELPAPDPSKSFTRVVARKKKSLVFLEPEEIWAFEAMDRLTYVHSRHGKFDLDLSLSSIEESFGALFTRVHRSWLVNATSVRELERDGGETRLFVGAGTSEGHDGIHVPVARERAQSIRELLLTNATGLRRM